MDKPKPFLKVGAISEWHRQNRGSCPICLVPSAQGRILCKAHDKEWNAQGDIVDFINDGLIPVLADSDWIANA